MGGYCNRLRQARQARQGRQGRVEELQIEVVGGDARIARIARKRRRTKEDCVRLGCTGQTCRLEGRDFLLFEIGTRGFKVHRSVNKSFNQSISPTNETWAGRMQKG